MNPILQVSSKKEATSPYRAADELVRALTPAGEKQNVERGDRIFSFDDAAEGVYLIMTGVVRASLPGGQGRELVSRTAGPGSVLGLPSALCSKNYQFDVEALEPVEALFLPTASLNEVLRQHPELCMQVMSMMCDELSTLRQTRDHMQGCGKHSCSLHERCTQECGLQ